MGGGGGRDTFDNFFCFKTRKTTTEILSLWDHRLGSEHIVPVYIDVEK